MSQQFQGSKNHYMHPHACCSIIYYSQGTEANSMSTDRRMDKENVTHTHTQALPLAATVWMDLEGIMLHGKSQTEKKTNTQ